MSTRDTDNDDQAGLQRLGLRATPPRRKVMALFRANPERHLSAEDVHGLLDDEHAGLGLTTIYRVLAQLEAAGLIKRSSIQPERAIYELDDGSHHDHLVCTECGRVEEFEEPVIEQRQREVAAARGFRLIEHALCIYGVCSACAGKMTDPT